MQNQQSRRGPQMSITPHTQREENHRRGVGALRPHPAHRPTRRRSPRTGHYRPGTTPTAQPRRKARTPRGPSSPSGRRPRRANVLCAHRHRHRPHAANLGRRHALPAHLGCHCQCVRRAGAPRSARSPPTRMTNNKYLLHLHCGCNRYSTTARPAPIQSPAPPPAHRRWLLIPAQPVLRVDLRGSP